MSERETKEHRHPRQSHRRPANLPHRQGIGRTQGDHVLRTQNQASDAATGKVDLADMPATFLVSQERKALEFLVVSVDGDTNASRRKARRPPRSRLQRGPRRSPENPRPFSSEELSAAWHRYFSFGTIEYPEQTIALLCREMKWTYEAVPRAAYVVRADASMANDRRNEGGKSAQYLIASPALPLNSMIQFRNGYAASDSHFGSQ